LSVNAAVKAMFGYEAEELVGEQMPILMPERLRSRHRAGLENHLATGKQHIPWTGMQLPGRRKDGEEIPLEISFGSYTVDGEIRFTGFVRDISERRKAEAALLNSEKLAAVGRLASSIAHEINNPLESVTNLLFLSRGSDNVAEIHRYLESAEQELARVSVIANQTLQFNRSASKPALVKCDPLLSGSLALFQGRLQSARVTASERRRAQRPAFCVEGEMRQVMNNLVGNAIDALQPRGGQLLLRSRDATDWKSGQEGIVLTVADDGIGMSAETLGKSFEAFFSTKGANGVGLGLWICRQLVQQNRGRLRVRSSQRDGQSGTVFTLFLPCADGREAAGAAEVPADQITASGAYAD
jgi:PAS domain S-box-containing protein